MAGDEVIVAPGVYREAVSPVNGGREDARMSGAQNGVCPRSCVASVVHTLTCAD